MNKGITTSEQAEAMREAYRAKCDHRRRGAVIETVGQDGHWGLKETHPSISSAKRASRKLGRGRCYAY